MDHGSWIMDHGSWIMDGGTQQQEFYANTSQSMRAARPLLVVSHIDMPSISSEYLRILEDLELK